VREPRGGGTKAQLCQAVERHKSKKVKKKTERRLEKGEKKILGEELTKDGKERAFDDFANRSYSQGEKNRLAKGGDQRPRGKEKK